MSNYAAGVAAGTAAGAAAGMAAARRVECRMIVENFDAQAATIEQRRDYADCVDTLHPDPLTGGQVLLLKVLIVLILAGGAAGVWYERESYGFVDKFMGFLMGAIGALVVILTVLAVLVGAWFLFT